MGQTVKKTLLLFLLSVQGGGVLAQGFWAPGACWVYEQLHVGPYLDIYMYTGDTMIDGLLAQQCTRRICNLNLGSGGVVDTSCVSDIWGFRDWVSQQGDVVYYKGQFPPAAWDTLYYLGVPGDRWWPPNSTGSCAYFGMLEIQDTGHVVIDGVNLRTWSLAYLDSAGTLTWGNGQALGSDTLAIIERIGGLPRKFTEYGYDCFGPIDPPFYRLQHYSDWQITTGSGVTCDIALRADDRSFQTALRLNPNPGSSFQLAGLSGSAAQLRILDMQGRAVLDGILAQPGLTVTTSELLPGAYLVEVRLPDGRELVLRWVKE